MGFGRLVVQIVTWKEYLGGFDDGIRWKVCVLREVEEEEE